MLLLLNIGENPTHAAYTEKPKILKVPGTFPFNGIQKVSESCLCYNSFNFILALNKLIILYTYSIYAIEIYYSVHVLLAKTVHHVNYDLNNKFMYWRSGGWFWLGSVSKGRRGDILYNICWLRCKYFVGHRFSLSLSFFLFLSLGDWLFMIFWNYHVIRKVWRFELCYG